MATFHERLAEELLKLHANLVHHELEVCSLRGHVAQLSRELGRFKEGSTFGSDTTSSADSNAEVETEVGVDIDEAAAAVEKLKLGPPRTVMSAESKVAVADPPRLSKGNSFMSSQSPISCHTKSSSAKARVAAAPWDHAASWELQAQHRPPVVCRRPRSRSPCWSRPFQEVEGGLCAPAVTLDAITIKGLQPDGPVAALTTACVDSEAEEPIPSEGRARDITTFVMPPQQQVPAPRKLSDPCKKASPYDPLQSQVDGGGSSSDQPSTADTADGHGSATVATSSDKAEPLKMVAVSTQAAARHAPVSPLATAADLLVVAMLVGNAVTRHIAFDRRLREPPEEDRALDALELVFCIFFVVELAVRLLVRRRGFFCDSDRLWNVLDLLIVSWGVVEQAVDHSGDGDSCLVYLSSLRLLRFVKLALSGRVLRLCPQVLVLSKLAETAVRSVVPLLVLALTTTHFFAMVIVQLVGHHLRQMADSLPWRQFQEDTGDGLVGLALLAERAKLEEHWGSVGRGMLSLMMAVSGGEEWAKLSDPLKTVGSLCYSIFLTYIAVFTFIIANMIVAAVLIGYKEVDVSLQVRRARQGELSARLIGLLGSNTIDLLELQRNLHDGTMNWYLEQLGLAVADAEAALQLLMSRSNVHRVDVDMFVQECIHLTAMPTNKDLICYQIIPSTVATDKCCIIAEK